MGEVHGVAENPLIIADVVAELDIKVVALEWPRGLELALHDLARLAALPPKTGRDIGRYSLSELAAEAAWFGDGRVTAGHFAVLPRLAVEVVAVDEPLISPSRDARDRAMAANIEHVLRSGDRRVLFVAGNLHTRLRPHEHYRPAGSHLARHRPDLSTIDIHYAQGHFWNCGSCTFPISEPPDRPHLTLEEATEAVVLAH